MPITHYTSPITFTSAPIPARHGASERCHGHIDHHLNLASPSQCHKHIHDPRPLVVSVSAVTYCNINPESYLSNFRGSCYLFALLFLCPLVRKEISECLDRSPIWHF